MLLSWLLGRQVVYNLEWEDGSYWLVKYIDDEAVRRRMVNDMFHAQRVIANGGI